MSAGETVAVLGAGGTMGQPMARNIAQAGIEVRAWNRTREKAEPLADDGIEVFDRASEAASGAGVILTIVSDADAVRDAMDGPEGGAAGATDGTISGGPVDNPYAQLKGKMMVERTFEPSFKLALAAKDADLVMEAVERHNLELPMLEAIEERLHEAAREHGDEDMAATYLASAPKQPAGR